MKKLLPAIAVFLIIGALTLADLLVPASAIIESERRAAAKFPDFSFSSVINGDFTEGYEDYALDSFFGREFFRKLKALALFDLFFEKDKDGVYIKDGSAAEIIRLDEKGLLKNADKILKLIELLPDSSNFYYSVIPDKGHFLAPNSPGADYARLLELLSGKIGNSAEYIDIISGLNADMYYKSDLHWDASKIGSVADAILGGMGAAEFDEDAYTLADKGSFHGVYYGQTAGLVENENMWYYIGEAFDSVKVFYFDGETGEMVEGEIYNDAEFDGVDPYSYFLSGSQPIIVMENDNAATDKELVIFRDSFTSSLAPTLIGSYAKVTLIDLRLMSSRALDVYADISENSDVLFLYGMQILNNGESLMVD